MAYIGTCDVSCGLGVSKGEHRAQHPDGVRSRNPRCTRRPLSLSPLHAPRLSLPLPSESGCVAHHRAGAGPFRRPAGALRHRETAALSKLPDRRDPSERTASRTEWFGSDGVGENSRTYLAFSDDAPRRTAGFCINIFAGIYPIHHARRPSAEYRTHSER